MNSTAFNRLYTVLVTPMFEDGSIDWVSFENLLRIQEYQGCGILILGSTGEALALDFDEQCEVVRFVTNLNLNVPIMVGVGGFQLTKQLQWIEFCQTQRVDCFLVVTPLYAKPGSASQTSWFKTVLDRAERPCMLYNVPSRTGVNLAEEVLTSLKDHPNLWALKEASGDVRRCALYQELAPNLAIYSGEDGLLPELADVGAKGLVSVISNIWPEQTKEYVKQSLAHQIAIIDKVIWEVATRSCFSVTNPIPVKAWLAYSGVITTNTLRAPLLANELEDLSLLIGADSLVKDWFSHI
ncbi:4-hydroxy-tetrahydrodipicolinate synthase [Francisella philomiragia]|uniref:4-hydroxy-tetrahydrodipicolinate synthase n=1 Tax=Francisella philomiragia TaxID=28110 RepID=UPI003517936A